MKVGSLNELKELDESFRSARESVRREVEMQKVKF
jgi:hypothetical protein